MLVTVHGVVKMQRQHGTCVHGRRHEGWLMACGRTDDMGIDLSGVGVEAAWMVKGVA